jgi:hypothetical protein
MSSAASAVPIARSSSHRAPPAAEGSQRPHRSQSTRVGSSSHRPTASQQAAIANVVQRDFEQTNLAQATSSSRRNTSRDQDRERSHYPARTDSMRAGNHRAPSSRGANDRYGSKDDNRYSDREMGPRQDYRRWQHGQGKAGEEFGDWRTSTCFDVR